MRLRTPKDIGAAIREHRRLLGLDQGELARRVGVSRLWINQVERGKPGAGIGLVLRTLTALGIELSADTSELAGGDAGVDINAIVDAARRREQP